ncbi:hypothetical protein STCU_09964 [Strigomonas culicis]|uniref:Uncharacterized protein n=1 Tax=Strigomonas culicis TaxID=28005 RepID=S9V6B1_9TRYP|nr:hypothetical protein STCU_09964 [Strigomonas culicis]|eukprot:EPY18455.1 hypothetical protein STCU_09964 [Strigomonas culicis]
MTQLNPMKAVCCNCGCPAERKDFSACTAFNNSCARCGSSMRQQNVQQLSNKPTNKMERRSSIQWRPDTTVNSEDDTNSMRSAGGKKKDATFVKNVKNIQRRLSNSVNALLSSKKDKRTGEIQAEKGVESNKSSAVNGTAESDSAADGNRDAVFSDFLDKSNKNPFQVGQAPKTGAAPAKTTATKTGAVEAPAAPRQHRRAASQPLTDDQKWNTITSEEMHRPKIAKKKTELDAVVDSVVDGAKKLKRRMSMSMNVLFSSEARIQSFYGSMRGGSMYGDSMAGEAAPAPLYGNGTTNDSPPPIGDLPINKGWEPFQEDNLYDMLKTQATTNNNTDVKDNTAPVVTKEVPPVDQKATAAVSQSKHDGARSPSPMNSGDVSPASLGEFA